MNKWCVTQEQKNDPAAEEQIPTQLCRKERKQTYGKYTL